MPQPGLPESGGLHHDDPGAAACEQCPHLVTEPGPLVHGEVPSQHEHSGCPGIHLR
ncbi:hypothetical protein [Streptomyces sp. NPDC047000]|uniref:hypothetical protein n=1 Tax=Streptomyces sp. NPDC047000 TaxID=3155474 RepID=UPI0033CD9553